MRRDGKNKPIASSEDREALMAGRLAFDDLTDVRLLKPAGTDALAGHARPTLATQLVAPNPLRMITASGLILPRKSFERTGT